MRFQAETELAGEGKVMWLIAYMPFDCVSEFGSGGTISVQGTVNRLPFLGTLYPRKGRHFLVFNKKLRETAGLSGPGELVDLTLELDRRPKTDKIPPVLQKAIDANKPAKKFFDELPPSSKRYRAEMVNAMKSVAAKERKAASIVKTLADTAVALAKTPEFVLKALAKSPVAKSRWQKLTPGRKKYFLVYLMDGKTQETRERRALKMVQYLLRDKGEKGILG